MGDETEGKSLAAFGLCLSARAAVVEKQMGADPNLPGPGAYIDPVNEGRNPNGEMKATLSHQKAVPSIAFGREGANEGGRPIEKQARARARARWSPSLDAARARRHILRPRRAAELGRSHGAQVHAR